ncbi:FMN-dependent NADH-azoreductase [Luteimonas viscosa]|uniref:FMN dependent NADH:quinone oxidoreductase n=1 Tax=Luteimonas viscosa TaxID=1132694 RepID=A0A5D4XGT9_9GAMM|nr:NAD(P)H-dependent oxidoreductase [Luteimonas viscosa]TYT23856.1 FMN-dependent NADH-azoreductase [Luteimonas viscosa]
MKLLHIDSSVLGDQSVTRELTAAIVARWRSRVRGLEVQSRDLARDPLPHLSAATLAGSDALEAARGETALREFLEADVVVIGAPMYNFAIPSTLKAWIDRIAVRGRTFRYTENGPVGLAGGKRVIVATAAGGIHDGQPSDFVEPYLRHTLGFLGVQDIEFVRADGIGLSPEHRAASIAAALGALPGPERKAA